MIGDHVDSRSLAFQEAGHSRLTWPGQEEWTGKKRQARKDRQEKTGWNAWPPGVSRLCRHLAPDGGVAIFLGVFVILSAAKNLAGNTEVLRCAQNDRLAKLSCHAP
jgi:hypothetical protein